MNSLPISLDSNFARFGVDGPVVSRSKLMHGSIEPELQELMINGWHRFVVNQGRGAKHPLFPMMYDPFERAVTIKTITPWFQRNDHAAFEISMLSAWEMVQGRSIRIKPGDHLLITRPGTASIRVLFKAIVQD